jgi:nitrogen regulatory protein PII
MKPFIRKSKKPAVETPASPAQATSVASASAPAPEAPAIAPKVPEGPAPAKKYEDTHALERLDFLIVIVNEGQDSAVMKILMDNNVSSAFSSHGKGTASGDFYEVFGLNNNDKHVVFSIIKESTWGSVKKGIEDRFAISNYSKGLAVLVDIDSVCGVSAYKFLTNTRTLTEGKGVIPVDNIEKKDDYQVVMAIVNDGFTDLVMDAAKKAGARGGTILTAHGTGNKEIEKFFGVVITPEKQIVMVLVPKVIKDKVIESIYKEVGINTKGRGIAFSFPCSDVVGIVSDAPAKTQQNPAESASNSQNPAK